MAPELASKIRTTLRTQRLSQTAVQRLLHDAYDPWPTVRGLLKGKRLRPVEHQRAMRKTWER